MEKQSKSNFHSQQWLGSENHWNTGKPKNVRLRDFILAIVGNKKTLQIFVFSSRFPKNENSSHAIYYMALVSKAPSSISIRKLLSKVEIAFHKLPKTQ